MLENVNSKPQVAKTNYFVNQIYKRMAGYKEQEARPFKASGFDLHKVKLN